MKKITKEEKKQMKNLMKNLETKKLLVLEIHGDFSEEQIEDSLCEFISDCIQKGLLNLNEATSSHEEIERLEEDDEDIVTLEYPDELPFD